MMASQTGSRSSFVGRVAERAFVRDALTRSGVRLLTITGPGGVGKTRLALTVTVELAPEFSNGAQFIPLADVRDANLVLAAIAGAIGMPVHGPTPLVERLQSRLANAELLLVLDNLEHVAEARSELLQLLEACPELTILATSRKPLRVHEEHIVALPPLQIPNLEHLPKVDELGANEAVELFVQRARIVDPEFSLTEANAVEIAEICARLEGLPLAIELAAARLQVLSPAALLKRLATPLAVLSPGGRDMLGRQQTLRNVIAWSDGLLSAASRTIFYSLSVFAGGCDAEAAEAVCGDQPGDHAPSCSVLDALTELLDYGLLRREVIAGEPRFILPEAICEYALERLEATGESEGVHRRHAHYFLALAREMAGALLGAGQEMSLAQLEREHQNFHAALSWSLDRDPDTGLRLAAELWRFWYARGYLVEGQHWLERALATPAGEKSVARVRALNGLGVLVWVSGNLDRALDLQSSSLALATEIDDAWGMAAAQGDRAVIEFMKGGDEAQARETTEDVLRRFRGLGDRYSEALSLSTLGSIAQSQGDLDEAKRRFQEALAVTRQNHDLRSQTLCLFNLGQLDRLQGDLDQAAAFHHESLILAHRLGMQEDLLYSLAGIAAIAVARRQFERAARVLGAVSAMAEEIGIPLQPVEQAQFDRDVALARAVLGDKCFSRAWDAGRRLTLNDAVAEAWELSRPRAQRLDGQVPPDHRLNSDQLKGPYDNGHVMASQLEIRQGVVDQFTTEPRLSQREIEVLQLLKAGYSDQEIAEKLFISYQTVVTHVKHIRRKLGVHSRAAAAAYSIR